MNFDDLERTVSALFNHLAVQPLSHFCLGLRKGDRTALKVLLAAALALGFFMGRRRTFRSRHAPTFQNSGEALVSRLLLSEFGPPDYRLMNHVTIQMDDGTTQVDRILISRFGVFVIETKEYKGWIFANATHETWTQVLFRLRFNCRTKIAFLCASALRPGAWRPPLMFLCLSARIYETWRQLLVLKRSVAELGAVGRNLNSYASMAP